MDASVKVAELSAIEQVKYVIIGEEIGEEGTFHHQGYIQLVTRLRFPAVVAMLPASHLEIQKSNSNNKARVYCKKGGAVFEGGEYTPIVPMIYGGVQCLLTVPIYWRVSRGSVPWGSWLMSILTVLRRLSYWRKGDLLVTPPPKYYRETGVGKSCNTAEAVRAAGKSLYFKPSYVSCQRCH